MCMSQKIAIVVFSAVIVIVSVASWKFFNQPSFEARSLSTTVTSEVEQGSETFVWSFVVPETIYAHTDHVLTPDGPRSQWMYDYLTVPYDMAITQIDVRTIGATNDIIHHLSLAELGVPGPLCGSTTHSQAKEFFTVSRTNLDGPIEFPDPYVVLLKSGQELVFELMTHVLEQPYGVGGHYDDVTVEVTFTLAEEVAAMTPLEFVRLRLDESPCELPGAHQAFVVPAHSEEFRFRSQSMPDNLVSDRFTFPTDSYVITRGANIWGGKFGHSINVYKNETLLESYEPYQGAELWQWYVANRNDVLSVAAGDTFTLEAIYHNTSDVPVNDATGMFGFYYTQK